MFGKRLVVSAVCVLSVFQVADGQAALRAGVARAKLTPPESIGASLGGYGERMSKPAVGVHDHVYAKALVLADAKKKYALVTLDALGLPPGVKALVIERLAGRGWSAEAVMFLASHSHASIEMSAINPSNRLNVPQIGIFQPELLSFVVQALADVIERAEKDLTPVKVGTARKHVKNMNRNRRGDKVFDPDLVVTRVDKASGKPLAILVGWTAHPTFMDAKDMYFSGGWPGYLQRELEALIGGNVTAMYYNGAEGDQSPTPPEAEVGSNYERAERYGRALALHAWEAYRKVRPAGGVTFAYNMAKITLPAGAAHPDIMKTGGAEYGFTEELMDAILTQITPRQTHSTALRLGDLLIAGVPGEMICSLGLQIKDALRKTGAKFPVIGGLANEWISYILTPAEYDQGGYEASVSFYGPTLGPVIVEGVLKAAKPLAK